jgi:hypothetical protein
VTGRSLVTRKPSRREASVRSRISCCENSATSRIRPSLFAVPRSRVCGAGLRTTAPFQSEPSSPNRKRHFLRPKTKAQTNLREFGRKQKRGRFGVRRGLSCLRHWGGGTFFASAIEAERTFSRPPLRRSGLFRVDPKKVALFLRPQKAKKVGGEGRSPIGLA